MGEIKDKELSKGMAKWWKQGYKSYKNASKKKPLPEPKKEDVKEAHTPEEAKDAAVSHAQDATDLLVKGLGEKNPEEQKKLLKQSAKHDRAAHIAADLEVKREETSWSVDGHGRFRRVDERAPDLRGGVGAPLYGSVADSPARKAAVQRPVQKRTVSAPVKKPVAAPVKKPATSVPAPVRKPTSAPQTSQGHPPGGIKTTPRTTVADTKPTNIATQNPPTIKPSGAATTAGVSTPPTVSTISKVAGALTGGGVNIGRDIGAQTTLTPLPPRTLTAPQQRAKIQDIAGPAGSVGPKISTDVGPTSSVSSSTPAPRIDVTSQHTGEKLSVATKLGPGLANAWKNRKLPEAYSGEFSVRKIYDADKSQ